MFCGLVIIIKNLNSINSRRPWPPILISHLFQHGLFLDSWPQLFLNQGCFGWDKIIVQELVTTKNNLLFRFIFTALFCSGSNIHTRDMLCNNSLCRIIKMLTLLHGLYMFCAGSVLTKFFMQTEQLLCA